MATEKKKNDPMAEINIDPELKPKSAIAYVLAQAIFALGKDELKRVRDNLTRVNALLDDYEASRKGNRAAKGASHE